MKTSAASSPRNSRHISPVSAGLEELSAHHPGSRTGSPMEQQCGAYTACVEICPQHAFTGRPFNRDEPREARFDAAACDRHFRELEQSGGVAVCGLCLYVCPHGRKSGSRTPQ